MEHSILRRTSKPAIQRAPRNSCHWSKPAEGTLKINVDAAIGKFTSVIAAVARNWRGELIFACSNKANTNVPLQVEAEAIKWVVSLANQLNFVAVLIEGDCLCCYQAIDSKGQEVPWRIRNIIREILISTQMLPSLSFCWVPREANMAAHILAKWSLQNIFVGSFDLGHCPSCLDVVIRKEALTLF